MSENLYFRSYEISDVSECNSVRCEVIKTIESDGIVTNAPGKRYIGKQGITITIDKRKG